MATGSAELLFAQRLVSNDRKTRDKAIKKIKKYLHVRSKSKKVFTDEDFLKIWKGLHFCLWMQDKPLIQEELVDKITSLALSISTPNQVFLFMKVFLITESREWMTLDKWRLDKFMMLIRRNLREMLHYVQNNNWNKTSIDMLCDVLHATVMNPFDAKVQFGFRAYFNLIFLEELFSTGLKKISSSKFCQILEPFFNFIQQSTQKEAVLDVMKKIFNPIVTNARNLFCQVQSSQLQSVAVCEMIEEKLFTFGKDVKCSSWQRRIFYDLVKKIRDVIDASVILNEPVPDYEGCNLEPDIQTSHQTEEKKAFPSPVSLNSEKHISTIREKGNKGISPEQKSVKRRASPLGRKNITDNSTCSPNKKKKVTLSEDKTVESLQSLKPVTSVVEKKVVFDMKRNTALKFKKSMKISVLPVYSPDTKPDQGILKSPTNVSNRQSPIKTGVKNISPKILCRKEKKGTNRRMTRSRASDFF